MIRKFYMLSFVITIIVAGVSGYFFYATGIRPEDLSKMKLLVLPATLMALGYFGACIIISACF